MGAAVCGKGARLWIAFAITVGAAQASANAQLAPLAPPSDCKESEGYASTFGGRRTFFLKPGALTAIKNAQNSDAAVEAAIAALVLRADAALTRRPGSVIDKSTVPLSGDRHDYTSIAPYWWPNPSDPGGPYIRHDGEVNPARGSTAYDRTALARMSDDAETLSLAYFYVGNRKYADKAAEIIRTWFLAPGTAMNPNAKFAQAVPGREEGRAEGVLDSNAFMRVIDAVGLIGPSGSLSDADVRRLENWFGRYVDWMLTSPTGREEQAAKNNHGLWFDAQIAQFALFARRPDIARRVVMAFPRQRIAVQFDPSGALPAELTRTRSFHYSLYALEPSFDVAEIAGCLGLDLWNYADSQGRGLRKATDLVAGYRNRPTTWPYKELDWPKAELDALLARAAGAWSSGRYPRTGSSTLGLIYRLEPSQR